MDKENIKEIEEKTEEEILKEEREEQEETSQGEETQVGEYITDFEYNVTNEEEEEAFLIFQKKYVYRHNWLVTAMFGFISLLFLISIIRNPGGYLNWVLMFICLFMIFATWFNTVRIRKYLMSALKALEEDRYRFTLYDDSFKIETVFTNEEMDQEDFEPVKPRIVRFDDITLNIIENKRMFIIILKKETIYVLPKRSMKDNDKKLLREKFSEVLGEDLEIRDE